MRETPGIFPNRHSGMEVFSADFHPNLSWLTFVRRSGISHATPTYAVWSTRLKVLYEREAIVSENLSLALSFSA